jgi:hypothetical protein
VAALGVAYGIKPRYRNSFFQDWPDAVWRMLERLSILQTVSKIAYRAIHQTLSGLLPNQRR